MHTDLTMHTDNNKAAAKAYVQVAYIVADVEKSALMWATQRGAGPFFLKPYQTQGEVTYQGRPATLDHVSAYGQYGDLMIELIQPLGEGPSVYRDHNGKGAEGLHHFALMCDDLEASIAEHEVMGYPLLCRTGTEKTPAAFMDARDHLGHMIELCQASPSLHYLYQFVAEAARGWDGSHPVRDLLAGNK